MKINYRKLKNSISATWMITSLTTVLLIPLAIGLGLAIKASPILQRQSLCSLLLSTEWLPMSGKFGFYPFIISSVAVTALSFIISAPVCLLAAIYLTQYSRKWLLTVMQPVIDILAGIPSVVYGVWGILVIVPFVANYAGPAAGIRTTGYSLLAGAIVLAVMSIPFILSILIEVFNTIAVELKEASLSLGATLWETIKHVLLREGFSGIVAAFGLGISKALGETIAVLMVVGNVARIPENVFSPGYPLPALIANNYGEMMSIPMYDSALMLAALILFIIVLLFNVLARLAINRGEAK